MQLPAESVSAAALIEVVRLTTEPVRPADPFTGDSVALWTAEEAASALDLIVSLPGSEQHRCGYHPGWAVRAYDSDLVLALFEAQFCFGCHEVRLHGPAVPPPLAKQFFDPAAPESRVLLARFRAAATAPDMITP
ncbi:hypothetical protein OG429_17950 [Streptomyces sp. NBC_00190]|uniref:hypothetical protein n=1 Tax=unclassified Streptomyces TaxID=2593676 RepID=UPI002E2B8805|nr:hypothetical protein [Streptomyces sp. NBC_00190]WSZ40989.1 hypothetical protein OG239_20650 [Streptomyces sp. NBC_00868]